MSNTAATRSKNNCIKPHSGNHGTTKSDVDIKEALDLELSFLEVLLKESRAQHGNTGYYRKMCQTVSMVRKYQFVLISQVVAKIEFKCSKLESDVYSSYSSHKLLAGCNTNDNTVYAKRGIEQKWCSTQRLPLKNETTRSTTMTPASPIDADCSLCYQIQWLFDLHKKGTFQEFTSRMHSAMHSIYLETSRGFFLPLLSVATAALSRVHSVIMIYARHAILAMLSVRDKLQPIFHHVAQHNQLPMMPPHHISRYVVGEHTATTTSWSQFQNFIHCTFGSLSYTVDLQQYMEITTQQYDEFLARANQARVNNAGIRKKKPMRKKNTDQVSSSSSRHLEVSANNAQGVAPADVKKKIDTTCHDDTISAGRRKKRNRQEEDLGESIHHQDDEEDAVTAASLILHVKKMKRSQLNAADVRQLEDANSVILSSLLPKKTKTKKNKAATDNEFVANTATTATSMESRKQKKSSRSSTCIIDDIFSCKKKKTKSDDAHSKKNSWKKK